MRRGRDEDPFDDLFREIERLVESVMGESARNAVEGDPTAESATHLDVHQYDDRVTVIADLPGVEKEAIEVESTGTSLSIRARGPTANYVERVTLPVRVDETSATASFNNGVLEVELARSDDSADIDVV